MNVPLKCFIIALILINLVKTRKDDTIRFPVRFSLDGICKDCMNKDTTNKQEMENIIIHDMEHNKLNEYSKVYLIFSLILAFNIGIIIGIKCKCQRQNEYNLMDTDVTSEDGNAMNDEINV